MAGAFGLVKGREKFISGNETDDVDLCDVHVTDESDDVTIGTGNSEVSHPLIYKGRPFNNRKKTNWSSEGKVLLAINAGSICLLILSFCFSTLLWQQISDLREQQNRFKAQLEECQNEGIKQFWDQDGINLGDEENSVVLEEEIQGKNDNELVYDFQNVLIQSPNEFVETDTIIEAESLEEGEGHLTREKRTPRRNRGNNNRRNKGGAKKKNKRKKKKKPLTTDPPDPESGPKSNHKHDTILLLGTVDYPSRIEAGKKFQDWTVSDDLSPVDINVFVYQSGEVTVKVSGVYFVYSQVTYYTEFPSVAHTVNLRKPGVTDENSTVIMKCLSHVERSGDSARYVSCYTGRAVYLSADDSVYISDEHGKDDVDVQKYVAFHSELTYWGMFKLY